MRPIIGIPLRCARLEDNRPIMILGETIRLTIQKAGGIMFPIIPVQNVNYVETRNKDFPPLQDEEKQLLKKMLSHCDGIIFPGGKKFTPQDRYLLQCAIDMKIPVLGICLGMQMMACHNSDVVIDENKPSEINHFQETEDALTHEVSISKDSKLYNILKEEKIKVNSFHRRHILNPKEYNVIARSSDGLIEAIEYPSDVFNVGLQWHPEISYDFDINSKKIIDYFINECSKNKEEPENKVKKYNNRR